MATEIVASSSSAADDRKAMRSVSIVARRCRSLTSRTVVGLAPGPAVGDERRQAADDVEEVARE